MLPPVEVIEVPVLPEDRPKKRKRIPYTLVEASKGNRCPTPGGREGGGREEGREGGGREVGGKRGKVGGRKGGREEGGGGGGKE